MSHPKYTDEQVEQIHTSVEQKVRAKLADLDHEIREMEEQLAHLRQLRQQLPCAVKCERWWEIGNLVTGEELELLYDVSPVDLLGEVS